MEKLKKIASDGLIFSNPALRLVLGTCPTLALTTAASNGIGMGLAVTFVLICANVLISLLQNVIPNSVRIPAFILIIATFVTIVKLVMDKSLPDLYSSLGVYLPLIVVNCVILGRAESFAFKNPVFDSALDGLFMGLGCTGAMTLMGAVRELLSNGSVFGISIWNANAFSIGFFGSSAGAFLTYAIFIAVFNYVVNNVQKKRANKEAK
jgi:electron transport complex protein RnfE